MTEAAASWETDPHPVLAVPTVVTNAQGQFTIQPAPVGRFKLMADGGTAQRPGRWPTLEYDIVTVAGANNTVGMPIFLPKLDTVNQLCVSESTGGTLTLPQIPGFALTVQPGSATFPGGARTGCVTVTPVHNDKVPMVPSIGNQPRFIVTIQPVGATFNPPAAMSLPNTDSWRPGQTVEMYSYDHDLSNFISIGPGTATEDGCVMRSNPGVGVLKAGWHGGGAPLPSGNPAYQWNIISNSGFQVPSNLNSPILMLSAADFSDDDPDDDPNGLELSMTYTAENGQSSTPSRALICRVKVAKFLEINPVPSPLARQCTGFDDRNSNSTWLMVPAGSTNEAAVNPKEKGQSCQWSDFQLNANPQTLAVLPSNPTAATTNFTVRSNASGSGTGEVAISTAANPGTLFQKKLQVSVKARRTLTIALVSARGTANPKNVRPPNVPSAGSIQTQLNLFYGRQANVTFVANSTIIPLPFDLKGRTANGQPTGDGLLETNSCSGNGNTDEMDAIKTYLTQNVTADYYVVYSLPFRCMSATFGGFVVPAGSYQKFAWINPNMDGNYPLVIAHEIGHALGAMHTLGSTDLMKPQFTAGDTYSTSYSISKALWHIFNP